MPAVSEKQKKFMDAVAHNPAFAKKVDVPQSVGSDFSEASKGMKFSGGPRERPDLQRLNKPETLHGKMALMKKGGIMEKHEMHAHHMKMAHHHLKEAMKHGGHVKKMATGGVTGMHGVEEKKGMTTAKMAKVKEGGIKKHGEHSVQERGHTRGMEPKMAGSTTGMKRGGKTHHKK